LRRLGRQLTVAFAVALLVTPAAAGADDVTVTGKVSFQELDGSPRVELHHRAYRDVPVEELSVAKQTGRGSHEAAHLGRQEV
jgi:hypothetical protein